MTKRFMLVLMMMLTMAGASFAQSAPSDTAAPAAPAAAAPDVNVHVDQPAPAAPQVNVEMPTTQSSTSSNTSVTKETTVVKDAPSDAFVSPWILIGGGVALVIVLLFVAMAAGNGSGRSVTTVS